MTDTAQITQVTYDVLRRDGKAQFVVLKWEDYQALMEKLEDAQDLVLIERARQENAGQAGVSTDQLKDRLGLE